MKKNLILLMLCITIICQLLSGVTCVGAAGVLSIGGADTMLFIDDGNSTMYQYWIMDESGSKVDVDAVWSLETPAQGVRMDKYGNLKLAYDCVDAVVRICAVVDGETLTKTVKIKEHKIYDFEPDGNHWGNTADLVQQVNSENYYLKCDGSNKRSPEFEEKLTTGIHNIEFDIMKPAGSGNYEFAIKGAKNGEWWWALSPRTDGADNTKISSFVNNYGKKRDDVYGWDYETYTLDPEKYLNVDEFFSIKAEFNFDNTTRKAWVKGANWDDWVQLYDMDYLNLGNGLVEQGISQVITNLAIDNYVAYSGVIFKQQMESIDTPLALLIPDEGKEGVLDLTATVREGNYTFNDIPVNWEVVDSPSFVQISGSKMKYTSEANGKITLKASIPVREGMMLEEEQVLTKEIEFKMPDVFYEVYEDKIDIKGKANQNVYLKLYGPKYNTSNVAAFFEAENEDAGTPVFEQTLTTDNTGVASFDISALAPGKYRLYSADVNEGVYSDLCNTGVFDHKINSILTVNAVDNMSHEDFETFLSMYVPERTSDEIAKFTQMYANIVKKDNVASLMNGDINLFFVANAYQNLLEKTEKDDEAAEILLTEMQDNEIAKKAIELLNKNFNYSVVTNSVTEFGNIENSVKQLKDNAILYGIKNVVNKKDAKVFLAALENDKYDGLNDIQKTDVAVIVAGMMFQDISELNRYIDNLRLGYVVENSGGGSSGSKGGSGGGKIVGSGTFDNDISNVTPPVVVAPDNKKFNDVSDDFWGYEAISKMADLNILNGYENGDFRPDNSVSRAEMVKMFVVAFNISNQGKSDFADVMQNDWYYPYIATAYGAGLVLGSDGFFNPEMSITREDAAVMLRRFIESAGFNLAETGEGSFADGADISDYATVAVSDLAKWGIMNGSNDGKLYPKNSLTRAEAAQLIYKTITVGGVSK